MEYMQASLFDVIYEPSFSPYRSWDSAYFAIVQDIAKGMSFIHFNGLLHRDLKPGNVLLDAQWVAKVADFGNALDDTNVDVNEIAGTPPYMAPEIIAYHKYDRPVDVWAFGCIIAHMASGQIPYGQLNLTDRQQMLNIIKSGECSPLELLFTASGCPKLIINIAKDCCMPEPSSRPDFQQIASRFDDILPEDRDPRPLVRIKNKKVSRLSIAGPKDVSGEEAAGGSGPAQNEGFHSTYRGKFKKAAAASPRGASPRATSTSTAAAAGAGAAAGGLDALVNSLPDADKAPSPDPDSQRSQRSNNFMDSFADVFLATFTPGQGQDAASTPGEKKEEEDEDDFV